MTLIIINGGQNATKWEKVLERRAIGDNELATMLARWSRRASVKVFHGGVIRGVVLCGLASPTLFADGKDGMSQKKVSWAAVFRTWTGGQTAI